jgi:hypothetical protein
MMAFFFHKRVCIKIVYKLRVRTSCLTWASKALIIHEMLTVASSFRK